MHSYEYPAEGPYRLHRVRSSYLSSVRSGAGKFPAPDAEVELGDNARGFLGQHPPSTVRPASRSAYRQGAPSSPGIYPHHLLFQRVRRRDPVPGRLHRPLAIGVERCLHSGQAPEAPSARLALAIPSAPGVARPMDRPVQRLTGAQGGAQLHCVCNRVWRGAAGGSRTEGPSESAVAAASLCRFGR